MNISEFYIPRNVEILKLYLSLRNKGVNVREASAKAAEMHTEATGEKISGSLVWNLVYREDYPYAKEAWAIIHKEEEEKEKTKAANGNTKTVAGEVATA